MLLKYFVFLGLINADCQCLPNGVSNSSCLSMMPNHGNFAPKTSIAPVQILPQSITIIRGQQMKITVRSVASNYTFKGFLIQARAVSQSNEILGTFIAPLLNGENIAKTMLCGHADSTVSHGNSLPKSNFVLTWKSPVNYRGHVRFQ